jgi:hypothetical protein
MYNLSCTRSINATVSANVTRAIAIMNTVGIGKHLWTDLREDLEKTHESGIDKQHLLMKTMHGLCTRTPPSSDSHLDKKETTAGRTKGLSEMLHSVATEAHRYIAKIMDAADLSSLVDNVTVYGPAGDHMLYQDDAPSQHHPADSLMVPLVVHETRRGLPHRAAKRCRDEHDRVDLSRKRHIDTRIWATQLVKRCVRLWMTR